MANKKNIKSVRPTLNLAVSISEEIWKGLSTLNVNGEAVEKMVSVTELTAKLNEEGASLSTTKAKMKDGKEHLFIHFNGSNDLSEVADEYDVEAVLSALASNGKVLSNLIGKGVITLG